MTGPLRYEQGAKRVRGLRDGETVFDTVRPVLVWEHDRYPTYYIPRDDVRAGTLAGIDGWEPVALASGLPELIRFRWRL